MTQNFLSYARGSLPPLPARNIAVHHQFSDALCASAREAVIRS